MTQAHSTTQRQANHLAISDSGTVHYAADSHVRPYHVLACNGRAMEAAGVGINQATVSCRACIAGERTGRIQIADPVATDRAEDEPCQRGTVGCSVDHHGDTECATW